MTQFFDREVVERVVRRTVEQVACQQVANGAIPFSELHNRVASANKQFMEQLLQEQKQLDGLREPITPQPVPEDSDIPF